MTKATAKATPKPLKRVRPNRVMLTLSPEAIEVLTLLSSLTGKRRTKIVTEFVEMSIPTLKQVCRALQKAQEGKNPQKLIEQFKHSILQELGD